MKKGYYKCGGCLEKDDPKNYCIFSIDSKGNPILLIDLSHSMRTGIWLTACPNKQKAIKMSKAEAMGYMI